MQNSTNKVTARAKVAFENASKFITNSSGIKQFAIGGVSGWCTGFLSTRVGKTVAVSVGGSIIILGAANQAGLININWDKLGGKMGDLTNKVENKMPAIKANVGKYTKNNNMFVVGFVGGFLLGLAS